MSITATEPRPCSTTTRVLQYVSLHQFPAYPGTGWFDEQGEGTARGTTINIPLPPGPAGDVYRHALDELAPDGEDSSPIGCWSVPAYDAHDRDPLADLRLVEADYGMLGQAVAGLVPAGRLILFLEGGYDLGAIKRSVAATLEGVAGNPPAGDPIAVTRSRPGSSWNRRWKRMHEGQE